jgi:hypothetical protein
MATQRVDSSPARQGPYDIWLMLMSIVLVVGIVVQAFLGTEALLKGNGDMKEAHAQLGNILFLIGVVQVVFGFLEFRKGRADMTNLIMRVVLLVLVTIQIGLGYSTRDASTMDSRIWHMTNGVLLIAVCGFILATDWYRLRRTAD